MQIELTHPTGSAVLDRRPLKRYRASARARTLPVRVSEYAPAAHLEASRTIDRDSKPRPAGTAAASVHNAFCLSLSELPAGPPVRAMRAAELRLRGASTIPSRDGQKENAMRSISTQRVASLLMVVTILVCAMPQAAAAGRVAKFKGNGGFIEVYGDTGDGCTYIYLHAGKGGTSTTPTTYMSYGVYDYCSQQSVAWGDGPISNGALSLTRKGAMLKVTPVSSTNFQVQGTPGTIYLTLTSNGVFSTLQSGHSQTQYLDHVYRWHGTSSASSATVTGTFLNFAIDRASGAFGESRDKYMEIERGN